MPTYDYQCEGSDRVFEVSHPMSQSIKTWAELAACGDFTADDFPAETAVRKVFASSGAVISSSALKNPEAPPCVSGGGCPGGSCGI